MDAGTLSLTVRCNRLLGDPAHGNLCTGGVCKGFEYRRLMRGEAATPKCFENDVEAALNSLVGFVGLK